MNIFGPKPFESRDVIRKKWLNRALIAVACGPALLATYQLQKNEGEVRKDLLSQIFNYRVTPEEFRPHIRRIAEDKTLCEYIPYIIDAKREKISAETLPLLIQECTAVLTKMSELENLPRPPGPNNS
ncbi:MAG: hypothetical protein DYH13_03985 [Alphaproteobacteria bacterium PRO2]|nr:hypothetical protein [Alphaproteobacteria bacterium PRO2]